MKQLSNIKIIYAIIALVLAASCASDQNTPTATDTTGSIQHINAMLDSFNVAAAKADYNTYFNFYTADAIFTGTDATERWNKQEFMAWAKPIFDKGSAWNFSTLERHIYFDKTGSLAWFDELLNTQMKICRGSGVLVKEGDDWKVKQYILSAMVPNSLLDSVIKLKAPEEDAIISKLSAK